MDDLAAMNISSMGMTAQRTRMRVIAENLANQHTTGPDGPYERKQTILESIPMSAFEGQLQAALTDLLSPEEISALHGVGVSEIRGDGADPVMRLEPGHPHADENGYVAYPNIDTFREMTDLIEATRSYEANLAAMKTTRDMINSAMEVLG